MTVYLEKQIDAVLNTYGSELDAYVVKAGGSESIEDVIAGLTYAIERAQVAIDRLEALK